MEKDEPHDGGCCAPDPKNQPLPPGAGHPLDN